MYFCLIQKDRKAVYSVSCSTAFQQLRTLCSACVRVSIPMSSNNCRFFIRTERTLLSSPAYLSPVALAHTPWPHASSRRTWMRLERKSPSWRLIAGKGGGRSQGAAGGPTVPMMFRAGEIWMERGHQSPPGKMSTKESRVTCTHSTRSKVGLFSVHRGFAVLRRLIGEHILFSKLFKEKI